MDPESTDIALSNIFSRYGNRCNNLKAICLADFTTKQKSHRSAKKEENKDEDFESEEYINYDERKILRYRRYKLGQDAVSYTHLDVYKRQV